MNESPDMAVCRGCGATVPRAEMFGVQDDLRCPDCAHGTRERLQPSQMRTVQFKPTGFIGTKVVLGIAIALYAFTGFINKGKPDPAWLAAIQQSERVWDGQWWRHIGSMFLHGDTMHILMNGMSVWFIGRIVEMGWGWLTLVGLTLFTGVAASASHWIFSSPIPAVGLSGALFGLVGFLWALKNRHPLARAVMTPRMQKWILGFMVLCFVLSWTKVYPIANAAHVGGMAAGFVFGLVWEHKSRKILLPLAALGCIALVVLAQFLALGTVELRRGGKISSAKYREMYMAGMTADSPHGPKSD